MKRAVAAFNESLQQSHTYEDQSPIYRVQNEKQEHGPPEMSLDQIKTSAAQHTLQEPYYCTTDSTAFVRDLAIPIGMDSTSLCSTLQHF